MDCEKKHPVARSVLLVEGSTWRTVITSEASSDLLGIKAIGLLRVPANWVPPFFVVSGSVPPDQQAITDAAQACGITSPRVYLRSNGTQEGLEERGALDSQVCELNGVAAAISAMKDSDVLKAETLLQQIHFIVQERVPSREQGHLSNERRLSRHPRDWHAEFDGGALDAVGVRLWRDASSPVGQPLECSNKASIARALRAVAAWGSPCRAHFEWIWDGAFVWIVQLDLLPAEKGGVSPKSLVSRAKRPAIAASDVSCFKLAGPEYFSKYGKLKNARIYSGLGYKMPDFFVMDDEGVIKAILDDGKVPAQLREDLEKLCAYPFVIRTDAVGLGGSDRQMLPRSDELRSADAAMAWLTGPFRQVMSNLANATSIVLIGHHFIPATASAWAQAQPSERRVRIESLWGIPEGTYYFAHDVYDVDTAVLDTSDGKRTGCREISSRLRYKAKFIAPNIEGEWIVQNTDESSDWVRSIHKTAWLKEIAWTTRLIATEVGTPVVVMWFVDVPSEQSSHQVLPWYHEGWEPAAGGYKKADHRKKLSSAELREISSRASWEKLKVDVSAGVRVERIFIDPGDSEIIRDRDFIKDLAEHAKLHGYVVELSGGLLSHAFYMLNRAGCNVECVDLFGIHEEQIEYNKLVRDLIPSGIEKRGEQVEIVKLCGDALVEALKRKIVEEVYEVADARSVDSIVEEIADVQEVIDSLLKVLGIGKEELAEIQNAKRQRRGGFNDGTMLVRTTLAPPLLSEFERGKTSQLRQITRQEELPLTEQDFHIDRRIDISGQAERQLTITLPAQAAGYASGTHRFDLDTASGDSHEMFFTANVERSGAILKLRVKLTNAAVQLELPLTTDAPKR